MKNDTVSSLRKAMIWMVYAFEWVSCISALSLVGGWGVCLQCIWNGVQWESIHVGTSGMWNWTAGFENAEFQNGIC